jgi:Ca2+-binding RTX toxin-like protein
MLAMLGVLALGAGYVFIGLPSGADQDGLDSINDYPEDNEPRHSMIENPAEDLGSRPNQVVETLRSSSAEPSAVSGGDQSDILIGTPNDDLINGFDGDDRISSGNGADTVYGGCGTDTINAGGSNDTVFGGANYDTVVSGDGDDKIYGGAGQDSLHGQNGNDWIFGGDDKQSDLLVGGAGDDVIVANHTDRVILGDGSDTVETQLNANISISDFDVDFDTLLITRTDGMQVDDLDFVDTDAGLEIQFKGQPIAILAGHTSLSDINISLE